MPAWYAFAAKYFDADARFSKSGAPAALGIYHPILAAPPIRITEVVVTDATGLEATEDGLWWSEVFFKRYRPPKKASKAPVVVIPAASAPEPVVTGVVDAELAAKGTEFIQQFNDLPGSG